MTTQSVQRILYWHLLLLPVLVMPYADDSYHSVKAVWLAAAAAWLGGGAVLALGAPRLWPGRLGVYVRGLARDPVGLAAWACVASALLSTLTSMSPAVSLWGAEKTSMGFFFVAGCAMLFFSTRQVCAAEDGAQAAEKLLEAALIGGAVVAIYALVQAAGLDPLPSIGTLVTEDRLRPGSSLGHSIYVGAYLVALVPLAAWQAASRRSVPYAVVVLLMIVALIVVRSRAAWVGLGVELVLASVALAKRRDFVKWLGVGIALALGGAFLAARLIGTATLFGRFDLFFDLQARPMYWEGAWNVFKRYPVLGSGLDTFSLAFPRGRPVDLWLKEPTRMPFSAHNEYLNLLVTQGLLGLLCALVFGALLARAFWKRRSEWSAQGGIELAIAIGLAGFLVDAAAAISEVASMALLVTLLGILAGLARGSVTPRLVERRPSRVFAAFVVLASVTLVVWATVLPLVASMLAKEGMHARAENPLHALSALETAVRLHPYRLEYFSELGEVTSGVAGALPDKPAKETALQRAALWYTRVIELAPASAVSHFQLAETWVELYRLSEAVEKRLLLREAALTEYARAFELEPHNPIFVSEAASRALYLKDHAFARRLAEQAKEDYPATSAPYFHLGYLALVEKRPAEAVALFETALANADTDRVKEVARDYLKKAREQAR